MLFKVIFVFAVSPVIFLGTVKGDSQENDVEKRVHFSKMFSCLPEVAKALKESFDRIKKLESKAQGIKDGVPGTPGIPGKPGKDGRDGLPGKQGPTGRQGVRGLPGPKSAGVQYIRWGRTSCPSGAGLVYKGRVGGEYARHEGGGANYVCLTESPKYMSYNDALQHAALMYGAEYRIGHTHNPFNKNFHHHDVPCAVCYVNARNTKLMIPGTYACPSGWTREYWGYLMTEHYLHKSQKEFICVDNNTEVVKGSGVHHHGAWLYPVEGRCGSLPCLPYVQGRELTCAVCTK